ncbi:MAG: hypothetical protein SVY41_02115 [Candidatus Nanohaloarchaea archaeon]|nr:hypothetical protein [Candidatus Nanohaloarchaea archaeon]
MTSAGTADDELTALEQSTLTALVDRVEQGDRLTGLRCGTAVCEQVLRLDAHGLVNVTAAEQDGDTWTVDLTLA